MENKTDRVVIKRLGKGKRTPEGDLKKSEVTVPGSPFEFLVYRRNPSYNRNEAAPGTVTVQKVLVLSLPGAPADAVQDGDIAYIPACTQTGGVALRARINKPRPYDDGIQCDLETGNQQTDTPAKP